MTATPQTRFEAEGFVLRPWEPGDAASMSEAVVDSYEHLCPWLDWASRDQDEAASAAVIDRFTAEWRAQTDFALGIVSPDDGSALGGTGFHLRNMPLGDQAEIGMWIRAGASNREMLGALGVDVGRLFSLVFALGAMFAGFAGAMVGPLQSVEVGMGEGILILTFVVVVIGGLGSIRGAFVGALLVGLVDTLGRAFLPSLFRLFLAPAQADSIGSTIATLGIYLLMAAVLFWRPRGLFPAQA